MKRPISTKVWISFLAGFLFSLPLYALDGVPEVHHGFPWDQTLVPGKLYYKSSYGQNRITTISYHNGAIYTQRIANGDALEWRFTDLNDPSSLRLVGTAPSKHQTGDGSHGYAKIQGNFLGESLQGTSPGVNERVNHDQHLRPHTRWQREPDNFSGRDDRSDTYYPWETPFTWHQYGSASGNAYIRRGVPDPFIYFNWFNIGATHLGKAVLMGDILILVDDLSNGGVTTFDLGPVFQDPPSPPRKLDHINLPSSQGGMGTYLPQLWGHILVLHSRNNKRADFVDIQDPENLRFLNSIPLDWDTGDEPGNNDLYAQAQDEYVFVRRAKLDMTGLLEEGGNAEIVLRFDVSGNNRPSGSPGGLVDVSQYMYPMGNLLITGPYSFSGRDALGVWAHQAEPDRRGPYVSYHRPYAGQTNFPLGAPVSIVINESLSAATLLDGVSVILEEVGGGLVECYVSFSHDDILTITPVDWLKPNTTYEVRLPAGGIRDVANNPIDDFSFRFSTGDSVIPVIQPPEINSVNVSPAAVEPGEQATVTVQASHPQGRALEYRFDPGDGSGSGNWSNSATFTYSYSEPGHFILQAEVRDTEGQQVSAQAVVTVSDAFTPMTSTKSGPMYMDPSQRKLWVVNPDNHSLARVDLDDPEAEMMVDLKPFSSRAVVSPQSVAVDVAGNVWVAARDDDAVYVLDAGTGNLLNRLELAYGSSPMHLAPSVDGSEMFLTLDAGGANDPKNGQLLRFDTASRNISGWIELGPTARALAVLGDRIFVSRFISPTDHGQIWEVQNGNELTLTRTLRLEADRGPDDNHIGRGIPNYLNGLAINPQGNGLYYVGVKSNPFRGEVFNNPATHDSTVRAMVGVVDLQSNQEMNQSALDGENMRIDVDNSDSPTALAFSPLGDWLFVSLQGNNSVAVFDLLRIAASPTSISAKSTRWRMETGSAPQGLRYDAVTGHLWVKNFMTRDVSALQLTPFLERGSLANAEATRIVTHSDEILTDEELLGKQLFYFAGAATDEGGRSEMSLETYLSCATCHTDGGSDHRVYDFSQRGEGLRNTTDLRGRAGTGHGRVHWSGNFDEIQDFELDIVNHFGGFGLLENEDLPHDPLSSQKNAGRSARLDALAAYVESLTLQKLPRSPFREPDGQLSQDAVDGAVIFAEQNCASCHDPETQFTDSQLSFEQLHNVGSLRSTSGERLGSALNGIDTPTLHGVWNGAPYLHDGSATDLEAVFRQAGGTVIEAESGQRSGAALVTDGPLTHDNSSYGNAFVALNNAGSSVAFGNLTGGAGGSGQISLRVLSTSGGVLNVQWNGQQMQIPVAANPSRVGWQWVETDELLFLPGENNNLTVTNPGAGSISVDAVLVTDPATMALAEPHRRVARLPEEDQSKLLTFVRSMDGLRHQEPVPQGRPLGVVTLFRDIDGVVSMEAENGLMSEDTLWEIMNQADASNSKTARIQNGSSRTTPPSVDATNEIVQYPFTVTDQPGNYDLRVRAYFPSPADDSFFWRLDGGSWRAVNNTQGDGIWLTMDEDVSLGGEHLLEVTYREDGSALDKFQFSRSNLSEPGGLGAEETADPDGGEPGPSSNTYAHWLSKLSLAEDQQDPDQVLPGNPFPNLLYYFLNLDPEEVGNRNPLQMKMHPDGQGGFRTGLLCRERTNDPQLRSRIQVAQQIDGPWVFLEDSPYAVTRQLLDPDVAQDGTTSLVLYLVTADQPLLFFRQNVHTP